MAILKVDQAVLVQTTRLLLQLADRPDDVRFTHGTEGSELHVPDQLALEFVAAIEAFDDEPDVDNGATPAQSAPSPTPVSKPPFKKAKR